MFTIRAMWLFEVNKPFKIVPYGEPAGLTLGKMYDCIVENAADDDPMMFSCKAKEGLSSLSVDGKVGWNAYVEDSDIQCLDIFVDQESECHTVSEFQCFLKPILDDCGRYATFSVNWHTDSGRPDYMTEHPEGIYYDAETGAFVITGSTCISGVRSTFFAL